MSAAAFGTLTGSRTVRTPPRSRSSACSKASRLQVAVENEHAGRRDQVARGAGPARAELVGGGHVGDRDQELAVGVEHGRVGAGRPLGARHVLDVHAGAARVVEQAVAQRVPPHDADQVHPVAEPGEVLGDVAGHAPGAIDAVPGLLVWPVARALLRALTSMFAPPTTTAPGCSLST